MKKSATREAIQPQSALLCSLMTTVDRRGAHGEAHYAALEAALLLCRIDNPEALDGRAEATELLGEALGALRAAVSAASHALIKARDVERLRA